MKFNDYQSTDDDGNVTSTIPVHVVTDDEAADSDFYVRTTAGDIHPTVGQAVIDNGTTTYDVLDADTFEGTGYKLVPDLATRLQELEESNGPGGAAAVDPTVNVTRSEFEQLITRVDELEAARTPKPGPGEQ